MILTKAVYTDPYLRRHSRDGVIRAATLEELGVPQMTTYRRCQPGGRWTHLLPGIVLLSRDTPTSRQRVEAALMHSSNRGMLTGFEAARRYGLKEVPAGPAVHVLIHDKYKISSAKFAVVERTVHLPESNMINDVPLAPPARAVLDGVRRIRQFEPVQALLIETLESGLCTAEELSAELESGSKRGTALPRVVLRQLREDIRSVPESESLAIWKRAALPTAERNVKIFTESGRYIAMPDTWCDEVALAWEIDSLTYHSRRQDYARTLERNNRYAAAGIIVVQTLPRQLRREPNTVVAELRLAYEAAKRRPRPRVFVDRQVAA